VSEGSNVKFSEAEALEFHSMGRPGKIEIVASKPMATQRDLSLAYSPGVAVPVRAIAANPGLAYDYTAKGNLVAVISNGTAILGLGNLGALAAKPVMEGKAVLFKRFADVDSIDIELDTEDPDKFIEAVALMEPSFGGINLEDIAAPECFIIEQALRERMNIPVMHDDQHGTAIISAAGLINACHLTGRKLKDIRLVVNGAGAAAIACTELIKAMGVPHDHVIMCDRKGVIYQGREGLDQWKSAHAVKTDRRTLEEALKGAWNLAAGPDDVGPPERPGSGRVVTETDQENLRLVLEKKLAGEAEPKAESKQRSEDWNPSGGTDAEHRLACILSRLLQKHCGLMKRAWSAAAGAARAHNDSCLHPRTGTAAAGIAASTSASVSASSSSSSPS